MKLVQQTCPITLRQRYDERGASLIEYTIATAVLLVALLGISVLYRDLAQNHVDNVLKQQAERQSPYHSDLSSLCYTAPDGKCY